MKISMGIVRETKSIWEKRTPLIPSDIKSLISNYPVDFFIQPSEKRIFSDEEYINAGGTIQEDISNCSIIIGIKEVKIKNLFPDKIYTFFSHTIKGQDYNMPMLQKIIEYGITLIDYEKIEDKNGKRLIFFSVQAGLAGIIDTLWALGKRFEHEGIITPFADIKQAYQYNSLEEAKDYFIQVGKRIKENGLPKEISPVTIGIAGYGNVSKGVQELLDLLPFKEISSKELLEMNKPEEFSQNQIYKIVFKEEDMVESIENQNLFDLKDYYDNPIKYKSKFEAYLPYLTVFINAIFWDTQYPRFVTNQYLKKLYALADAKLKVIGDISCDIEGGVECTLKPTDPGNPVYVFNPVIGEVRDGIKGNGPVIMAVEILPSEIPRESSIYFSDVFSKLLPGLLVEEFPNSFEKFNIPFELKNAVITYKGRLTPNYLYINKFLK
jgi:saccharopine dehydrogenase (NAD+, L-lysine forming)